MKKIWKESQTKKLGKKAFRLNKLIELKIEFQKKNDVTCSHFFHLASLNNKKVYGSHINFSVFKASVRPLAFILRTRMRKILTNFHEKTKNFSYSRCLRNLSIQQHPNKTMHPLFQDSRLKLNSNNVPFQFIALVPFKTKHHSQSPFLPCRCCKRPHHNFIVPLMAVPEAGLMLIRHVRPAPAINSQTLFTIRLRLQHHHLNWLIQQVHSNNRRYGQKFLSQQKKKEEKTNKINLFQLSNDPSFGFYGYFGLFSKFNWFAL